MTVPDSVKSLRGTLDASRQSQVIPTVSKMSVAMEAPDFIKANDHRHGVFVRLVRHCQVLQILQDKDEYTLAMLALSIDEVRQYTEELDELGSSTYHTLTDRGDKMHRAYPQIGLRADAIRRVLQLAKEFGLTPAAQKYIASGAKPSSSEWDDL